MIPKTYNGSGECTYNPSSTSGKPKKHSEKEPQKQQVWTSNLGQSNYQNQNVNYNANKYAQNPSVNDQKIGAIKEVLGSNMQNEEKLCQINDIVNQ